MILWSLSLLDPSGVYNKRASGFATLPPNSAYAELLLHPNTLYAKTLEINVKDASKER